MRVLQQLIQSYELYQVVIELAVIWFCVYVAFRFLRGTRGAGVIKGFVVLLVLLTLLMGSDAFGRLNFFYDKFLGLLAIVLIVVFQPELRQAMIRLGRARLFRVSTSQMTQITDAVAEAVDSLSKCQFGALIAIERSVQLGGLVDDGVRLDAEVSARLLEAIFWPNNPLHDLGVVIRGNRIVAASVQFPLVEEGMVPQEFGSRHRAAVGMTVDSDCLVVVVSEETGAISIAEHGTVDADIPRDQIRARLAERLSAPSSGVLAEAAAPKSKDPNEGPDEKQQAA